MLLILTDPVEVAAGKFGRELQELIRKSKPTKGRIKQNGSSRFPDNAEGECGFVCKVNFIESVFVATGGSVDFQGYFKTVRTIRNL